MIILQIVKQVYFLQFILSFSICTIQALILQFKTNRIVKHVCVCFAPLNTCLI
uniref:Uncharacterized protein n=1 Tax=Meloidogyne enterolobii TaxID=390850 RepID=A0A6V7X7E7_MELEN|nr:unnamed protein product [Meloidogyne enterolobii]